MHQQVGPAGDVCILEISWPSGRWHTGWCSIFATVASETMVTKANMKIDSDRMASTVNEPFPLCFSQSHPHGFFITPSSLRFSSSRSMAASSAA